jgi:hypothetical protein
MREHMVYLGVREKEGEGPPWFLLISDQVRREIKLPSRHRLCVRTGPNSDPIVLPVKPYEKRRDQSNSLVPIAVQKSKEGIVLGPIVGILTVRRQETGTFRGNKANFRDIARMGRRLGLTVAVFVAEDLHDDWMYGYVYQGQKRQGWKRMLLPLPTVVYNRVPDRQAERQPEVVRAKRRLKELNIPFFNEVFLNKRQLNDWISASTQTAEFLPKTTVLKNQEQIMRWMRRMSLLYVKPIEGKAGNGIIQVRREGLGWRVTAQQNGKRVRQSFATRMEAAAAVWKMVAGRGYLLQEGVTLATFDGRQFDLRLLVQKNRYGRWTVTGMGARVADSDGITTHVPNGGEIAKAGVALRIAFGADRAPEIEQRVREAAVLIAHTIERKMPRLGELSMDMGVDTEGHLWFFEANAKPMKFDEPFIRAKSLFRLLHYCSYLAWAQ